MSAVAKPRIRCKRPVMAKPKPRRMEQSIFKTIVEMAYEMDYMEKRNADLRNARTILMDIVPQVQTTLNPRVLRQIDMPTRHGPTYVTEPFLYRGISLRFTIFMEYQRIRDDGGKVRERGIITISPQGKRFGDYRCLHRMMFSRRVYNRIDEFPKICLDAVHGALCSLLWL